MTLYDLIRTPASRLAATAVPAIPATLPGSAVRTVARIATVAVAIPADANGATRSAPTTYQQPPSPASATGFVASLDKLAARQVANWRAKLEALPEPTDRRLAGIKVACLDALAQRWAHDAARLGWDDGAMFGLDPAVTRSTPTLP